MAVFTKLTKLEISKHLNNYNLGELIDFREIIEGIDNSNFVIFTSKGKFILTIFESRINKNDLPFFVNFTLHLTCQKICCPAPIVALNGKIILDLKEKKSIIVAFLEGKNLQPREDGYYPNITSQHCFEVGRVLSSIHLAAQKFSFKRANDLGIKSWRTLFGKFSQYLEKNIAADILQEINFLESAWRYDLPEVAAHLDLFCDNVFFDKNSQVSGVIDFYFAANDLAIYDFAITVNAWCFDEKNNFDTKKFANLQKGYELHRKFLPQEIDFLEIALRAAALRFLLTRLHDKIFTPKNVLIKIKDPQEYLAKLRYFQKM